MNLHGLISVSVLLFLGVSADEPLQQFSKDNLKFSANIYQELAKKDKAFIASPISAEIVLSLVAEGAKGDTHTELSKAVHIGSNQREALKVISPTLNSEKDDAKLLSANKIYVAEGFDIKKSIKSLAADVYKAGIENVNFKENVAAADLINKWVEGRTNNKIKDLIKPDQVDSLTKLVLVNVLYFTAKWHHPFTKSLTSQKPFYTSEKETKNVEMMQNTLEASFWHCGYLKAKFLELPFLDTNVTMTFILPDSKTGLADVAERVQEYLAHAKYIRKPVAVSIPKFTIRNNIDLVPILKELGVRKLFSKDADLSGISDKGGLSVSSVQQQAYIDVNESGVEAAAATAAQIRNELLPVQPSVTVTFNADHPFLYVLKNRVNEGILYIGSFR
ncbi:unnamed protein product [Acanthoscelides obtectus]|uniref:Serpin domain-containing protein n=1 Tax=Acanthoscelides obtectus TaxID=200917 RepID=A0A9P0K9R1_ACAOB|nr:unnamed protein product [Acanthoscelides obtectus]CAK1648389.1 Serine protease inhibitor 42Dd [Acanthoscelides obtectus]